MAGRGADPSPPPQELGHGGETESREVTAKTYMRDKSDRVKAGGTTGTFFVRTEDTFGAFRARLSDRKAASQSPGRGARLSLDGGSPLASGALPVHCSAVRVAGTCAPVAAVLGHTASQF